MFKKGFVALLIILSVSARAQERPAAYAVDEEFNLWNKNINDTAFVFADIAYIRDYPGLEGVLLDSLRTGTRVVIKSEPYNKTLIKDFHAPWYKVTYMTGKQKRTGFIWLGLLALGTNTDKEGKLWMYGFNKYVNRSNDEEHLSLCEIKVLDRAQQPIARTSVLISRGGQTYTEGKILDNMGLAGLQAIYRIGFMGEACGVSTNHYYIGWTGTEFVPLPGKTSVSDAGVFYHEEKLLFPSEHNLDPALIIRDVTDAEVIDPDQDELTYKEIKKRVKYIWDGKIASEVLELK
jgi:hypothetical protein